MAIPTRATFFVTYIMVDGWLGLAGEILMLKPLIFYHFKNLFLVKTEKDREEAMDPGSLGFNTGEPTIQFYFLLGLVHATVTPIILPFIIIFFSLAYIVFRHQVQSCIFLFWILWTKDNLGFTVYVYTHVIVTVSIQCIKLLEAIRKNAREVYNTS